MIKTLLISCSVLAAAAAVVYAIVVKRNASGTIDRLNDMIDKAEEGEFKASDFSESEVSALESRFADFLDSSLASKANMAEEKDRIKTMISDISHQTKTPIANLLLYSELLSEGEELSPEGKESVEMIHSQTEKLRFLIDSLVKLSRLESGIVAIDAKKNSLKELLDSVVTELGVKASEKGLKLTGPSDDSSDVEAVFDMKWTREALINIVENAIKYTDSGSVEISLSTTAVFARIDVKDSGIGISEEDSAKVFQRFYRSSEVSQREGVGIGLYLAREIITDEGGYIKLSSVKGEGTTFSIFVPVN